MSESVDISSGAFGQPPQEKIPYVHRITYVGTKLNRNRDALYISISATIVSPGENMGFQVNFPAFAAMLAKKNDDVTTIKYLQRTRQLLGTLLDIDPEDVNDLPSKAGAKTDLMRDLLNVTFLAEDKYIPAQGEFKARWEVDLDTIKPVDFEFEPQTNDISGMFSFENNEAF